MNESIFFLQVLLIVGFILLSSRLGKGAMIALSCLLSITANIFVLKQAQLFSLEVTCADAYAIGAIVLLNLVQDRYGKKEANNLIKINFVCMIFFTLMSQIHLLYLPSIYDWSHNLFKGLFSISPRLLLSSIAAYLISQKIDVEVFAKLRQRFPKKFFTIALGLSVFFSQLIDTTLFGFFALYGIVSSLFQIIVFSMVIKFFAIVIMSGITGWQRKKLKNEI